MKEGQKPLSGQLKCQSPFSVIDTLITGDPWGLPQSRACFLHTWFLQVAICLAPAPRILLTDTLIE